MKRGPHKNWLYVAYGPDGLVQYVADSANEMGRKMGVSPRSVKSACEKYERGIHKTSKYMRILNDEDLQG